MEILLNNSILLPAKSIVGNSGQIEGLPANPRVIKNEKFRKLVKSIEQHPEMTSLRELLVYPHAGKFVIIGGNMRFRAMKELGFTEFPCKVIPESATVEQLKAYILKDNSGFGEWDLDMLANEWDLELLEDCAIDVPSVDVADVAPDIESGDADEEEEQEDYYGMMLGERLYDSNNEFEIPNLLMKECPINGLLLPFSTWGADTRQKKGIATYHFYTDDYRFEALWKDPTKVLESGCRMVVEPNLSLFDTTPVAYGLQQIYKKRWISRYWQECGVKVFADLNVSRKFQAYNQMGIPDGYNAFATRGYNDRLEYLKEEIAIAKKISGKDVPNMIVYGGGTLVKKICEKESLIYVEQFMKNKEGV